MLLRSPLDGCVAGHAPRRKPNLAARSLRCAPAFGGARPPICYAATVAAVIELCRAFVEQTTFLQPSLRGCEGILGVGQEYDALAGREAADLDHRLVAFRNLVEIEMFELLRREVEVDLGALQAVHVFLDVGRIDRLRKHESDHERAVGNLAEAELLQHQIGQAPHAGGRQIAVDADRPAPTPSRQI